MAATKKKSGPSGSHVTARRQITLSAEEREAQDVCARMRGVPWAVWARRELAIATDVAIKVADWQLRQVKSGQTRPCTHYHAADSVCPGCA